MSHCKHLRAKRRLIEQGKNEGTYDNIYCTQQCKGNVSVTITTADILEVYPKGRPTINRQVRR